MSSDFTTKFPKLKEALTDFISITKSASNIIRANSGGFYSKKDILDAKKDINNIYKQAADIRKQTNEIQADNSNNSSVIKNKKLSKVEKKENESKQASINKLQEFVEQTTMGFHSKGHIVSTYEKLHQNPELSKSLDEIARMEKSGSINSKSLNVSAENLEKELKKFISTPNNGLTQDELKVVVDLLKRIKEFKYEQSLEKCKALADPLTRADSPVDAREAFVNANFSIVENAIQASQLQKTGKLTSSSPNKIDPTVIQNIKFGSTEANAAVAKTIPFLFDDFANTKISEQNGILKFTNPTLGEYKISLEDWKNGDRSKIPLTSTQKTKYEELVKGAIRNLGNNNPDLKTMFNPKTEKDFLYNKVYSEDKSYVNQAKRSDHKHKMKIQGLKDEANLLQQTGEISKAESLLAEANRLSSKKSDVEIQNDLSLAEKMAVRVYSTDDGCAQINGINRGFVKGWSSDKLKEAMMHSFMFSQGLDKLPDFEFIQEGSFGYRGESGEFTWGNVLQEKIDKGRHINVNTGFTSMSYATRDKQGEEYVSQGPSDTFFSAISFNEQKADELKSRWGTIYTNPKGVKNITAFSCFEDKERELVRGPGIEMLMGTYQKKQEHGENLTLMSVETLDYNTLRNPKTKTSPSASAPTTSNIPSPPDDDVNQDSIYKERI